MKFVSFIHQGRASYGLLVAQGVIDLGRRLGAAVPTLKALIAQDLIPLAGTHEHESPDA